MTLSITFPQGEITRKVIFREENAKLHITKHVQTMTSN